MVDYYVLDTEAEKANSNHLYPVEPLLSPMCLTFVNAAAIPV